MRLLRSRSAALLSLVLDAGATYRLVMRDEYGDGWNGAVFAIDALGVSYDGPADGVKEPATAVVPPPPPPPLTGASSPAPPDAPKKEAELPKKEPPKKEPPKKETPKKEAESAASAFVGGGGGGPSTREAESTARAEGQQPEVREPPRSNSNIIPA